MQNSSDNGSVGIDRHRHGRTYEGNNSDLAEGLRSSATLGAVSSQAADAPKRDGGDSTQSSDQQRLIVANAVNRTAKAKVASSKSSTVQAEESTMLVTVTRQA